MIELDPIPVTHADVERIVRRDFSPEDQDEAMELVLDYSTPEWLRLGPPHRVRVAMLKIADGDLEELRAALWNAGTDYRDVLAYAEYRREMAAGPPGPHGPDDETLRRLREEDRAEYEAWLHRE